MNSVFDTTILIDYLNRVPPAKLQFDGLRPGEPLISIVTWIEVAVGMSPASEKGIREFLSRFTVLPLSNEVAEKAAVLRRTLRLKLPDAAILATAEVHGAVLVTRNTKDFATNDPRIRVPYIL